MHVICLLKNDQVVSIELEDAENMHLEGKWKNVKGEKEEEKERGEKNGWHL